jgi:hypothetical protein
MCFPLLHAAETLNPTAASTAIHESLLQATTITELKKEIFALKKVEIYAQLELFDDKSFKKKWLKPVLVDHLTKLIIDRRATTVPSVALVLYSPWDQLSSYQMQLFVTGEYDVSGEPPSLPSPVNLQARFSVEWTHDDENIAAQDPQPQLGNLFSDFMMFTGLYLDILVLVINMVMTEPIFMLLAFMNFMNIIAKLMMNSAASAISHCVQKLV